MHTVLLRFFLMAWLAPFASLALATDLLGPALQAHAAGLRSGGNARAAAHLEAFYARFGNRPVWTDPARIEMLAMALESLADDGLDPSAYGLTDVLRLAHTPPTGAEARACADILATRTYLHGLADLATGRTDPAIVEPVWRAGEAPRQPVAAVLAERAAAGVDDPFAAFDAARPRSPSYHALRTAYRELRQASARPEAPTLTAGKALREGDTDPRVIALRNRLAWAGHTTTPEFSPEVFDAALAQAVRDYQTAHQLDADGVVGRVTRASLNRPLRDRLDALRANLERMRWLEPDLLPNQLRVDVAGARIDYVRNGEVVWSSRAQVGRRDRPTPLLRSEITHVTFHPPWVVPPTILRRDKLPAFRDDPGQVEEKNFRVLDRDGKELDPATIDWSDPGHITLRQDPGPYNPLGQAAIRFPNPFSVYLHDTPSQTLFSNWQRNFSSGCVRVERAVELVELLLARTERQMSVAQHLATNATRNILLPEPVSILIAYWTVAVDTDGRLQYRPDVYGHDARIVAALAAATPRTGGCPPHNVIAP